MKLTQKQGFKRRFFEITDDEVKVSEKSMSGIKEWTIRLENLGDQIYIEKNSKKGAILLGLFFLAFAVFFVAVNAADKEKTVKPWIWVVIGAFYLLFSTIIFLVPNRREIHVTGGHSTLSFFLDSPSETDVRNFVEIVINKSKKLLIEKYGKIDPDLPEETMINQLNWLKNRDLITVKEYKDLKKEYHTRKLLN
jgi:hypothetical protein